MEANTPENTIALQSQDEESYDMENSNDDESEESDKSDDDEEEETLVTLDDFYKTWKHVVTAQEVSIVKEAHGLPCVPGLCVRGVGDIPLPLNVKTAEDLKQVCGKTPHRNTLQVNADQVYIKNPAWKKNLDQIVQEVAKELGVMVDLVSSRLDKLLLQEESESVEAFCSIDQEQKVFAKLFVQLPSIFIGGSFAAIDGAGFKEKFSLDSEDSAPFQCHYVAHYSECQHETLPIDFGRRVVLVYSLLYNGSDCSKPSVRGIKYDHLSTLFRRLDEGVSVFGFPMENDPDIVEDLEENGIEALLESDRILAESALRAGGWNVVIAALKRVDSGLAGEEYWERCEELSIAEGEPDVEKLYLLDGSNGSDYLPWIRESLDISSIENGGKISWNETETEEHYGDHGSVSKEITYEAFTIIAFRVDLQFKGPPSKRRRTHEEVIVSNYL